MKIIKLIGSLIISFIIVNSLFAFYSTDAGWLTRTGGATAGVYIPGHYIINMEEGIGIRKADENGYLNASTELEDEYVLVFGKSHTNAIEVSDDERYVTLLSNYICRRGGGIRAYSVARGGNTFSDLLSGFGALIKEFDDSNCVILEMDSVGELKDLEAVVESQRSWTENDSVDYLVNNQSLIDVGKTFIKEKTPLLAYLINERISEIDIGLKDAFFYENVGTRMESNEIENDSNAYYNALYNALSLIRSEYENKIIILYHPSVAISKEGEMVINEMAYYDELALACEECGIELCDMTEVFLEEYEKNYAVPYGFMNTSMGTGHLNKEGHKMIADYLYTEYFAEVE